MEPPDSSHKTPTLAEIKSKIRFNQTRAHGAHICEEFLEKLAAKTFSIQGVDFIQGTIVYLAAIYTVISTIFVFPIKQFPDGKVEIEFVNNWIHSLRFLPLFVMLPYIHTIIEYPPNYVYKKHFTHIGPESNKAIKTFILMILSYFIIAICVGFRDADIPSIIGQLIVLNLAILVAFTNAQISTKLRRTIGGSSERFILKGTQLKDTGSVRIIESSVFKITLKNIGSEPWVSENFTLCRYTSDEEGKYERCFRMPLPVFNIMPQQELSMVPESHEYHGECIRIPGLHCFGTTEREETVKTTIFDANGKKCFKVEYDRLTKPIEGRKVTEHVASYEYIPPPPPPRLAVKIDVDDTVWTNMVEQ